MTKDQTEQESGAGKPAEETGQAESNPDVGAEDGDQSPVDSDGVEAEADPAGDDTGGEIEELRQEVEKLRDQQLRAVAEAENVRRRAETEVANSRKFAIEGFARELLSVRDSLDLASGVELDAEQDEVVTSMEEGLKLTLKQMDQVFEKFNISEVPAQPGTRPDPELHQAVSLVDSDEVQSGEIVSVMQKGYRLHDRLLRPAMVLVAK